MNTVDLIISKLKNMNAERLESFYPKEIGIIKMLVDMVYECETDDKKGDNHV